MGAIGIVAAASLTMLNESRRSAQMQACQARLGAIGAGSAQFALTYNGYSAGFLSEQNGRGTTQAHATEAVDIMRARGRPDMPYISGWLADVSMWSLSLVEFQDRSLSDPFNICPCHDVLNKWRRWPQAFDQGAFGQNQPAPSDTTKFRPYASTFRQTGAAFDRNQSVPGPTASPQVQSRLYQSGTTHNQYIIPSSHNLGPSLQALVAFPSQKVHVFEEHQRHFPGLDLYFMYDSARANSLFFDGSVRAPLSGDARTGWNPNVPSSNFETFVLYQPLRWEPPVQNPVPSPTSEVIGDSYRWTRDGLLGWDFSS